MNDITFSLKHEASESLFFISFVRREGKVQIQDKCFSKGNVVSIDAVRQARDHAERMLY
jgi:hypothetical protein